MKRPRNACVPGLTLAIPWDTTFEGKPENDQNNGEYCGSEEPHYSHHNQYCIDKAHAYASLRLTGYFILSIHKDTETQNNAAFGRVVLCFIMTTEISTSPSTIFCYELVLHLPIRRVLRSKWCWVDVIFAEQKLHHLHVNRDTRWQRKIGECFNYFRTWIHNVDNTLMHAHFELFSRILVYE